MSAPGITVRTRKFMSNPLMQRKQFVRRSRALLRPANAPCRPSLTPWTLPPQVLDVLHPGKANVSKARVGTDSALWCP